MPVIVTATFHPQPGKTNELIEAFKQTIPDVHDEAGCEKYAIHEAEDGTIVMIERWSAADDLTAHAEGEATAALNEAIAPFLAAPPVVIRMTPIATGQPEKGLI